jgi:hypothetical protein
MALKLFKADATVYGFGSTPSSPWWSEPFSYANPSPFKTAEARTDSHKKAWEWLDAQAKLKK